MFKVSHQNTAVICSYPPLCSEYVIQKEVSKNSDDFSVGIFFDGVEKNALEMQVSKTESTIIFFQKIFTINKSVEFHLVDLWNIRDNANAGKTCLSLFHTKM